MKKTILCTALAAALLTLSALFYWMHFLLFHDAHHIFIYLVGDIAFVPIEVLLVTLILHRLVSTWVLYLAHLKTEFPYLFSLAVRTNPLDASARAEVA